MIKSITIDDPYTVIDTIEDLLTRTHLKSKLYTTNTRLQYVQVFYN